MPASDSPSRFHKGQTYRPGTEQLGRYELLRRLAVGGMAEIFLARITGLQGFQKLLVIKRILPQLAADPEFVEMFLDEARLAATLQHSNIVQVHDIGAANGSYYLAMELLQGEDLRAIMKTVHAAGGRIPLEHAITIVTGACAGIHYAHEKAGFDGEPLNIVHRDVSPQNLFVTYDGCVKVLDFGIAKAANRVTETRSGTLKGKLSYMSPEQCRAEPLDRRSDLFALSIVLYELTTGRKLFQGANDLEILKDIACSDPPPPSLHVADYPQELERIVLKGLARDRDQRYQTALELQADLEIFARKHGLAVSSFFLARFMEQLFGRDCIAELALEDAPADNEASISATPSVRPSASTRRCGVTPRPGRPASARPGRESAGGASGENPGDEDIEIVLPSAQRSRRWPAWLAAGVVVAALAMVAGMNLIQRRPRGELVRLAPANAGGAMSPAPRAVDSAGARSTVMAGARTAAVPPPAAPPGSRTVDKRAAGDRPIAAVAAVGEISVDSEPWATVILDGRALGPTPRAHVRVSPGDHSLRLSNPSFHIDETYRIEVRPGASVKRRFTFAAQ